MEFINKETSEEGTYIKISLSNGISQIDIALYLSDLPDLFQYNDTELLNLAIAKYNDINK